MIAAARLAGGRSHARKTNAPTATFDVDAATAPSKDTPSSAGRRVPPLQAEEMVVDEHAVETGVVGDARHVDRDRRVLHERREREPELHGRATRSRASAAAPTTPAASPSSPATIGTSRTVVRSFDVSGERGAHRIEKRVPELDEPAGDDDDSPGRGCS